MNRFRQLQSDVGTLAGIVNRQRARIRELEVRLDGERRVNATLERLVSAQAEHLNCQEKTICTLQRLADLATARFWEQHATTALWVKYARKLERFIGRATVPASRRERGRCRLVQ